MSMNGLQYLDSGWQVVSDGDQWLWSASAAFGMRSESGKRGTLEEARGAARDAHRRLRQERKGEAGNE